MLRAWLSIAVLILGVAAFPLKAQSLPVPVARVALSVGEARRVDAAGHMETLKLGASLAAGDRIITGKDAVAILVFADEGRVSLRADSELLIRQYRLDPSGADTRLDLELVRGAIRQISGQAARLQPERYRLNTPIAAIGVRGTDFLAKTSSESMETFVQEGMIVVLSNVNGCAGGAPGTGCSAPLASVSASDAGQYLRFFSSGRIDRRVVSADELERIFGITITRAPVANEPVIASAGGAHVPGSKTDPGKPAAMLDEWSRGEGSVVDKIIVAGPSQPPAGGGVTGPVVPDTIPPVPVVTPVPPVPVQLPTQLVWGKFADAEQLPLQLPVAYDTARQGRHVTVGELGQYALWRKDPSGPLDPSLRGQAQFTMAAGEAIFQQGTQVSMAQIQNSSLGIDFDRALFQANMTLFHAQTGQVGLAASGRVNDEGLFNGGDATQHVAGALSRDGKEAGFLFSRLHELGLFRGVTLWNAR